MTGVSEPTCANILVVDDTAANLSLLAQLLLSRGYRVRVATNGKLALQSIRAARPDLILLDVMMPGLDGYEICTRLKADPLTREIPVIFLSALNEALDKVQAFAVGGADYITKPFEPVEVLARIEYQLKLKIFQTQLQAQNAQLQLLLHVTQEIAEAADVEAALQVVLREVCQTIGWDFGEVWVPEEDGLSLKHSAVWYDNCQIGEDLRQPSRACSNFAPNQLPYRIWRSKQAEWVQEVTRELESACGDCQLAQTLGLNSALGVPIIWQDQVLAVLLFFHRQPVAPDRRSLELVKTVATQLGSMIQRKRTESDLKEANLELERLATLDGLTHLANRRYFNEYLAQEWRRAAREQQPLALILADVDYFKRYNDYYGHLEGDFCLQRVAQAMKAIVRRPADVAARYGGEEFALILPNTTLEGAGMVAAALRQELQRLKLPHARSEVSDSITLSLGVAGIIPRLDLSPASLITAADEALYEAKHQGRDRMVLSVSQDLTI